MDTETSHAIEEVTTYRTPDGKPHTTYERAAQHLEELLAKQIQQLIYSAGVPIGPKAEARVIQYAINNRATLRAAMDY